MKSPGTFQTLRTTHPPEPFDNQSYDMLALLLHICLLRRLPAAPKMLQARTFVTTNARANQPNKQKVEEQNKKEKVKGKKSETMDIHQGKPLATTVRTTSARANRPNKQKAEEQNNKEKVKGKKPETMDTHQGKPLATTIRTTNARANRPNKQKAEEQNNKEKVKGKKPETMGIHQGKPLATTIRTVLVPLQDSILFKHASKVNSHAKHQTDTKDPSEKPGNSGTPPAIPSDKLRNQIKNFGKELHLSEPEANRLPRWVYYIHPSPEN